MNNTTLANCIPLTYIGSNNIYNKRIILLSQTVYIIYNKTVYVDKKKSVSNNIYLSFIFQTKIIFTDHLLIGDSTYSIPN